MTMTSTSSSCVPKYLSRDSETDPEIKVMETDIVKDKMNKRKEENTTIRENATPDLPVRYNPLVIIQRLTSAEIEAANSTNVNVFSTHILKSNYDAGQVQENPNHQTKTNIVTLSNNNSRDLNFFLEDNSPSTFADNLYESEFYFDLGNSDTFMEPKIEITVLDEDIDVDQNENGTAWGESTNKTSTTGTGPESDAAYEEFLRRYSPFVPLKRLTPQEIEDAAAGKLDLLSNDLPLIGRQLQPERIEDNKDDCDGEINTSLLNTTGTGIRFLEDCYEVFNEAGHIVFKPKVDHQNVDPPLSDTSIVCSLCKFVTDSKVSLKNHMKIHSKPLMCSHVDCSASFDTRPLLQQHYSSWHSPLKPYRCSYDGCYKAYCALENLNLHYSDHTGEYRFRCTRENCTAEYKSKGSLAYHASSVHSAERPFKCPRQGCLGSFVDIRGLRSHLRKHPVKRYSCSIPHCTKRFSSWTGAQAHMKKDFHSGTAQL